MLIRFSIITNAGIEVYSYMPDSRGVSSIDPQLLAGFMTAIQSFSEHIENPIRQIHFSNMMLYVRTYGDFGLQLLFEEKLEDEEVEGYFRILSRECLPLLAEQHVDKYPQRKIFEERLTPIITSLHKDPLSETDINIFSRPQAVSKIALVGLAKAGKTTIINMFFDLWTKDEAKNVKPTIGRDIRSKFLEFMKERLLIIDLGGQVLYRDSYLSDIEIWQNLSIFVYVLDIQNPSSFEKAKNYLRATWHRAVNANERPPKLAILFHKYDISKREVIGKNLTQAMEYFKDFASFSTFHLSTYDDNSGNLALVKTLYFSLPDILLRRLLEDKFLAYFEEKILPQFSVLLERKSFLKIFEEMKPKLRESAVVSGLKYGQLMQEEWMKYLIGEWAPEYRLLSSKSLKLSKEGQHLLITLPDYTDREFPRELSTLLLDGILDGILKTFHLEPPVIVKDDGYFITWRLSF